jgi:predicted SprT family Zn-dependent metalloprotease
MDTQRAAMFAVDLMETHGLYRYPNPWSFEFDNARARFGLCSFKRRVISLSRKLVQLTPEAEVLDTILHEIAHALAGPGAGHGRIWKLMAISIGAKPRRCISAAHLESMGVRLPATTRKWTGTCPAGHRVTRRRHLQRGRIISCARCCPHFNRAHAFVWTHADQVQELAEAAHRVQS